MTAAGGDAWWAATACGYTTGALPLKHAMCFDPGEMRSGALGVAALVIFGACSANGGSADGAASGPDADNHVAELNACLAAIDNDPAAAKGYVTANVVASGFDASQLQFVYLVERQEGGSVLAAAISIAVGGRFGANIPRTLKRKVPGELLWMAQRFERAHDRVFERAALAPLQDFVGGPLELPAPISG